MKNKKKIIILASAILVVFTSLSVYVYIWEFRKPLLDIYFFSLNKGRAVFIRTPQNMTILMGGGQNSEVIRELTKVMPFYSRKLDKVIIPSAVPAQIGGLIEVLNRYEIDEIIMPKILATSTVLTELIKIIHKNKIHIEEVERGDQIKLEKDLNMNVFFPYSDYKFNKSGLPELGLDISYKNTRAYLLGNLSKTIQNNIVKNIDINNGKNIIEFYNNAGNTKVSTDLIKKINPKYTWSTKEKTTHLHSDGNAWQR